MIISAKSEADVFIEKNNGQKPTEIYKNSVLDKTGLDMINLKKKFILNKLGKYDIIMSSPLTRAIQTCLNLYEPNLIDKKIYLVPLLTEIGPNIENKGIERNDLQKISTEILKSKINYKNIDFSNDKKTLFYYNSGWKTDYESGWENDPNKMKAVTNAPNSWIDLNSSVLRNDAGARVFALKKFLSNDEFTGKTIIMFSHCSVFNIIAETGFIKCPGYLGIIEFSFDQITGLITTLNLIEGNPISITKQSEVIKLPELPPAVQPSQLIQPALETEKQKKKRPNKPKKSIEPSIVLSPIGLQPTRTVNVKIIRHSYSTANEYKKQTGNFAADPIHRDPVLTRTGIELINKNRTNILNNLGNPDIIITSPLMRAIQTCLEVFNKQINMPIYLCPLVSEIGNYIENRGTSRKLLQMSPILTSKVNYKNIDFSNDKKTLFYYDSGWKKIYQNGWENDFSKIIPIPDAPISWVDLASPILLDTNGAKISAFKNFLSSDDFTNKNIVIFSHSGFMGQLLQLTNEANFLEIESFTYEQSSQKIINLKTINPVIIPVPIISKQIPQIQQIPQLPQLTQSLQSKLDIRVLSWNISWEAMTGTITSGVTTACPRRSTGITICLENIVSVIDNASQPYDFICLQEAAKWNNIYSLSNRLRVMSHRVTKSGYEEMVTFYDPNKYKLDTGDYEISGHLGESGRPLLILFFNNNLCVINMHPGHGSDFLRFDRHLVRILSGLYGVNNFIKKLQTYNIIMAGDMNMEPSTGNTFIILTDPYFKIPGGRILKSVNHMKTCCNPSLNSSYGMFGAYDQILTTYSYIKSEILSPNKLASDHLPIVARISNQSPQIGGSIYYKKYNKYKLKYLMSKSK